MLSLGQATFTFTQLGGAIGPESVRVAGTSVYERGEQVLVFLETGGGGLVELGVGAGKYRIWHQEGKPMVQRQVQDLAFARLDGSLVDTPPSRAVESLDLFETRIMMLLGE